MSQTLDTTPVALNGWVVFLAAGLLAGAASFPALHHLNDRYRVEPSGSMDPKVIEKEVQARTAGDWKSSALQGAVIGAIFGALFGLAEGLRHRVLGRGLIGGLVGAAVGAVIAIPCRNAVRQLALYFISNDMHGLHVSAATQGLLWFGPMLGAAVALRVAAPTKWEGNGLFVGAIIGGLVACFAVPIAGQIAFPIDYQDHVANHIGQSAMTTVIVGLLVGLGAAFTVRPPEKESFV